MAETNFIPTDGLDSVWGYINSNHIVLVCFALFVFAVFPSSNSSLKSQSKTTLSQFVQI
jgi:hypothetical protein